MSHLKTIVVKGEHPGPHLLVLAGVHGDEWEPMAAVRELCLRLKPQDLRGQVTLVPMVHEAAFRQGTRVGQDGLDLARTLGKPSVQRPTEELATELSAAISSADALVDLHTGGCAYYLMPLTGFMNHPNPEVQDRQRAMARAFGMPLVWGTPPAPGRTLSVANQHDIPAIYAEWGGGIPLNEEAVFGYVQGCIRVLQLFGMLQGEEEFPLPLYWREEDADGEPDLCGTCPSPRSGFWQSAVQVGETVEQGQPLGTLWGPDDLEGQVYPAPRAGLLICLRSLPLVTAGDSLARIIEPGSAPP